MAIAVIGGALVAVFEDFVGFVDFLEFHFARGIARILVRMPFHRELAESRLQLGLVGGPFDFQGFVVAALGGGHQSNPPEVLLHAEAAQAKDAAFSLKKNDPHPLRRNFALFGVGVMIDSPLTPTSCCACRSCRRRPRGAPRRGRHPWRRPWPRRARPAACAWPRRA